MSNFTGIVIAQLASVSAQERLRAMLREGASIQDAYEQEIGLRAGHHNTQIAALLCEALTEVRWEEVEDNLLRTEAAHADPREQFGGVAAPAWGFPGGHDGSTYRED